MHKCSGYVQFVNSTYQAFESDGSFEVCVQAEGYGFTVNVSAGMCTVHACSMLQKYEQFIIYHNNIIVGKFRVRKLSRIMQFDHEDNPQVFSM